MQVSAHDVETITYKTQVFGGFTCVTMAITDKNGAEMEIKLFADDLSKLNFINEGIKLVE